MKRFLLITLLLFLPLGWLLMAQSSFAVKKVFDAVFSKEVQKHVIGAGVELFLGISAALKAMPVPSKAQPIVDKMVEVRQTASSVYCAKNPECPRKAAEAKSDAMKIELD